MLSGIDFKLFGFNKNAKTQSRKYANLAPLRQDTISFTGKNKVTKSKENNENIGDSVVLDWIDNSKVRYLVEKVSSGNILEFEELKKVLEYFNIVPDRNTGDMQFEHSYYQGEAPSCKITTKSSDNKIKQSYSNKIKSALKVINKTNGELCLLENQVPTEETIAKHNNWTSNCPDEYKNPYRKKLEQKRKELENAKLTQEQEQQKQAGKDEGISYTQQKQQEAIKSGLIKHLDGEKKILEEIYANAMEYCAKPLRVLAEKHKDKTAIGKNDKKTESPANDSTDKDFENAKSAIDNGNFEEAFKIANSYLAKIRNLIDKIKVETNDTPDTISDRCTDTYGIIDDIKEKIYDLGIYAQSKYKNNENSDKVIKHKLEKEINDTYLAINKPFRSYIMRITRKSESDKNKHNNLEHYQKLYNKVRKIAYQTYIRTDIQLDEQLEQLKKLQIESNDILQEFNALALEYKLITLEESTDASVTTSKEPVSEEANNTTELQVLEKGTESEESSTPENTVNTTATSKETTQEKTAAPKEETIPETALAETAEQQTEITASPETTVQTPRLTNGKDILPDTLTVAEESKDDVKKVKNYVKLTEAQKQEVVSLVSQGKTYKEIAKKYGCSIGTISNIIKKSNNSDNMSIEKQGNLELSDFAQKIIPALIDKISDTYKIADKKQVKKLVLAQFTNEELKYLSGSDMAIVKEKAKQVTNSKKFKKLISTEAKEEVLQEKTEEQLIQEVQEKYNKVFEEKLSNKSAEASANDINNILNNMENDALAEIRKEDLEGFLTKN